MNFRPDIVVEAPGSPSRILLVVEIRARDIPERPAESQLRRYMKSMSCPVGLLVTRAHISVYKDSYTTRSERSIELVGTYPVPSDWVVTRRMTGASDREFELAVGSWLERVGASGVLSGFSPEAQSDFEAYVVPALSSGVIRGSGRVIA